MSDELPDSVGEQVVGALHLLDTPEHRHIGHRMMECACLNEGDRWRSFLAATRSALDMHGLCADKPVSDSVIAHDMLEALRAATERLRERIDLLDEDTQQHLEASVDVPLLRRQLERLEGAAVADDTRRAHDQESTQHPGEEAAWVATLRRLAEAFQAHEEGPVSDYENRAVEFLVFACYLKHITLPPERDSVLAILPPALRKPRGAPS